MHRFLLAQLHLESLRDKLNQLQISCALNTLPTGNDALRRAYDSALERIDSQLPGHREVARRVISWIVYSYRALSSQELQHAVAINIHDARDPRNNLMDIDEILSCCAGLVTLDREANIVRLVHSTTEQYFTHERLEKWIKNPRLHVAEACITYLSIPEVFESAQNHDPKIIGTLSDTLDNVSLLQRHRVLSISKQWPLLFYLFCYWADHVRPFQQQLKSSLIWLLSQNGFQSLWLCPKTPQWSKSDGQSIYLCWPRLDESLALNIALFSRLADIVEDLLETGSRLYSGSFTTAYNSSSDLEPLASAAKHGNKRLIGLLLSRTKPSKKTYRNALQAAVADEDTFSFLVTLPTFKKEGWYDKLRQIGFSAAAQYGMRAVARSALTNCNVSIDRKDKHGRTPFYYAAREKQLNVVQLFLTHSVSFDWRGLLETSVTEKQTQVVETFFQSPQRPIISADTFHSILLLAVKRGDFGMSQLVLANFQGDINRKDDENSPILCYAANLPDSKICKMLLKRPGISADDVDSKGRTPLSYASENDHESVMRILLDDFSAHADSKDNEGRTPLSFAVSEGRQKALKILLHRKDVDINSRDSNGRTPFSYAVGTEWYNNPIAVTRTLLETGRIDTSIQDSNGYTALVYASRRNNYQAIRCWFSEGDCDPALGAALLEAVSPTRKLYRRRNHAALIQLLLSGCGTQVNWTNEKGQTPLMRSLDDDKCEAFQLLLQHPNIDLKLKDKNGKSVLHYAAENGRTTAMKILLLNSSDGFDVTSKDNLGRTPLMYAASLWKPDIELLDIILERSEVAINAKDNEGRNALSHAMAIRFGFGSGRDVVQRLLRLEGINVNEPDDRGLTPLAHAVGKPDLLHLMLEDARVIPHLKDNEGKTPLFHAAQWGDHVSISLLLQRDLDPCLKDYHGRSPLFYAAWNSKGTQKQTLDILLRQPEMDVNVKDGDGLVALAYAVQGWKNRFHDQKTFLTLVKYPGIDLNAVDNDGRTLIALWARVRLTTPNRAYCSIGRTLLTDPRTKVNTHDKYGRTPVHYAAMSSNLQAIRILLEKDDIDLKMKDKDGWTALTWVKYTLEDLENKDDDEAPSDHKERLREIYQLLAARKASEYEDCVLEKNDRDVASRASWASQSKLLRWFCPRRSLLILFILFFILFSSDPQNSM